VSNDEGNALGSRFIFNCSLKGCDIVELSQPYRLKSKNNRDPRALPWAMLFQPFGLKTNALIIVGDSQAKPGGRDQRMSLL
jgi:hypothetical protein